MIRIKKGGKVLWNRDGEPDTDVTDGVPQFVMEPAVLDEDVTLRDILSILR